MVVFLGVGILRHESFLHAAPSAKLLPEISCTIIKGLVVLCHSSYTFLFVTIQYVHSYNHSFITFAEAHIYSCRLSRRNLHGVPSQDSNSGWPALQQASALPSELRFTLSELRCTLPELRCTLTELRCTLSELCCTLSELCCTLSELCCTLSDLCCTLSELRCTPG